MRRTRIGSDDLFKRAMKQPKAAKAKKVKNISKDQFEVRWEANQHLINRPASELLYLLVFIPWFSPLPTFHMSRTNWVAFTWAFKICPNFTFANAKRSRRRRRKRKNRRWTILRRKVASRPSTMESRKWKREALSEFCSSAMRVCYTIPTRCHTHYALNLPFRSLNKILPIRFVSPIC